MALALLQHCSTKKSYFPPAMTQKTEPSQYILFFILDIVHERLIWNSPRIGLIWAKLNMNLIGSISEYSTEITPYVTRRFAQLKSQSYSFYALMSPPVHPLAEYFQLFHKIVHVIVACSDSRSKELAQNWQTSRYNCSSKFTCTININRYNFISINFNVFLFSPSSSR